MKHILTLTAALLLLFCISKSNAQSNYRKGFILTDNGNNITGWIDYRQWEKNPRTIKVKSDSLSDITKTYSVKEIAAFEIPGFDRYVRAVVSIDQTPENINELKEDITYGAMTDTVFLRVLLKSKISLYEWVGPKVHFYIKEDGKDYVELLNKYFLSGSTGKLSTSGEYKNQLIQFTDKSQKPETLLSAIDKARYKEADIFKIVEKLNGQTNEAVVYKIAKPKQNSSPFIGAGLVYSSLKFTGAATPVSGLNYSKSLKPLITAGIDLPLLRNLGNLVMRLELSYYSMQFEAADSVKGFLGTDYISYKLKNNNLAAGVSLLYNIINQPKNKFYIGAGAAFNFASYPVNKYKAFFGFSSRTEEKSPYLDFEKTWIGIHAKAGCLINKKIELAASVLLKGSFTSFTKFSLKPQMASFNINYHFQK
jgi:hypothetical protein